MAPRVARANGRFPATNSVHFRPANQTDMVVGSTFGMLVTHDDGGHVYWVCEQAVGYNGTFDPKYAIATDGTIYATTFNGLMVSHDGGCTFTSATENAAPNDPGRFAGIWVDAIGLGPNDEVWVGTAESGKPNEVYESTDGAATFHPVGLMSGTTWWKSVLVAHSDAQRIYVAGYQVTQAAPDGGAIPPQVHIFRSDNAGTSWTEEPTTDFELATSPLVLIDAVSPTDPDVLFARSVTADPPTGDKVYLSTDGAQSWKLVLDTTDAVTGVMFRKNGDIILSTTMGGVFKGVLADDGNGGKTVAFAQLTGQPEMACVGERSDQQVFACGANWDPDHFALGRSNDLAAYDKVFRFVELAGPLECPAGTVQHDTCELELWPALKEQFGIRDPDGAPSDGPAPDAAGPPKKSGGCCDASGGGGGPVVLGLLVGAALIRRRRRLA